ncbi:MAG: YaeQ family protein [Bradymonadia bacterium]
MARPSIIRRFEIELSDIDRGRFESIDIRVAQHPSESLEYLATRLLILCAHFDDLLTFSKAGLCDTTEPPVFLRTLQGDFTDWFEIGVPSTDRLNKAAKAAQTVFVYSYRNFDNVADYIGRVEASRRERITLQTLDFDFLKDLGRTFERTNQWTFVRTEGDVFLESNGVSLQTELPVVPSYS